MQIINKTKAYLYTHIYQYKNAFLYSINVHRTIVFGIGA